MAKPKAKSRDQQKIINDALFIIQSFGVPTNDMTERQRTKMAMSFLALANMRVGKKWSDAKNVEENHLRTREIITYVNKHFGESISAGSYDDVRRKDLKQLTQAGIVKHSKPDSAQNDPARGYGISAKYCEVMKEYGMSSWETKLTKLVSEKGKLTDARMPRDERKIPIDIPGRERIYLSLGDHSDLHKRIIDDMLPFFCPSDTTILYLGDSTKKEIINEKETLEALRFFMPERGTLPDILAYSKKENWLYVIEAFHTSNPISSDRKMDLSRLAEKCAAKIIFITAFLGRSDFRKEAGNIAWETDVWLAEEPDHMIHFDGKQFLKPYDQA